MLCQRRAYSILFWVGFMTTLLVPLVALGVKLGRFFYARAEMYKVADAAALAAAQEMDVAVFRETGQIVLLPSAYGVAGNYATLNSSYLASRRIYPHVTDITVDQGRHTVLVQMAASADELVPLLGRLTLRGAGEAQVRGRVRP